MLKTINKILSKQDKIKLLLLLISSIVVSLVETVSISVVMLFISVATNFELVAKNRYYSKLYRYFGFSRPADFVIVFGIALVIFYGIRALINIAHIYAINTFAHKKQSQLAQQLFAMSLHFNYKDFVLQNSSIISQAIFGYTSNFTQVFSGLLNIMSETFTVACVYIMLFFVNWKMTLVLTLLLTTKIFIIIKTFSHKITSAGKRSQQLSLKLGRIFGESFSNFKFLKLINQEEILIDRFSHLGNNLARANIVNVVWQSLPRFILETIGFSLLVGVIVYVLFMYNNAQFVLPIVSLYALAFYRFLPSVNKILAGYNQIIFNKHALAPLAEYFKHETETLGNQPIAFAKTIQFDNVSFSYQKNKPIVSSVSFNIAKGDRVGLMGESGSGKSTVSCIFMGLLAPNSGSIIIDNTKITSENIRSWRSLIGYIPQSIYLFDGTVAENIACGRPLDEARIITVLKKAHLYTFFESNNGIHTRVGDDGAMLSGGQKQRIAIARALYGNPQIMILDEATSSLDHETEGLIMDEIYHLSKDITLIIIAHRLTTIERCNKIFKLEHGSLHHIDKLDLHKQIMQQHAAP